jgi:hypothetical protein
MAVRDISQELPCPCCGAWGGTIAVPVEVEELGEGLEVVRLEAGVRHAALKGFPRCVWWDHVSGDEASRVVERGGRLGLIEGMVWRWAMRRRVEAWRLSRGWS